MNIYALKNHRIKVSKESINSGSSYYSDLAKLHLEIEKTYTVKSTSVNNSYSSVCLNEVENVIFSSLTFIDIDTQLEEKNKEHPDWVNWNTEEGYEQYSIQTKVASTPVSYIHSG